MLHVIGSALCLMFPVLVDNHPALECIALAHSALVLFSLIFKIILCVMPILLLRSWRSTSSDLGVTSTEYMMA